MTQGSLVPQVGSWSWVFTWVKHPLGIRCSHLCFALGSHLARVRQGSFTSLYSEGN